MQSDMAVKMTHFSFMLTVNLEKSLHHCTFLYIGVSKSTVWGRKKEPEREMAKLSNRIAGEIHPRKMQTGTRRYSPCSWREAQN